MRRNFDWPQASEENVNVEYLKGLINVVPHRGVGDRAERYCVGRFAIWMYCNLLEERQKVYPRLFCTSVFLNPEHKIWCMHVSKVPRIFCVPQLPMLSTTFTAGASEPCYIHIIYDIGVDEETSLREDIIHNIKQFESVDDHCMLFVADMKGRRFLVYGSLATKKAPAWTDLIDNVVRMLTLVMSVLGELNTLLVLTKGSKCALLFCVDFTIFTIFFHVTLFRCCNGHDCDVIVMVFMDLLSLGVKELVLPEGYVQDNLLVSVLRGQIAHFPEALTW
ncbi:LOW QUALITY PROTEIN: hypothetical protein Cgig2_021068 [Carnegiea gigantea]|uniref:Uncharacterized protein n=1 Tax=Carnegiea gigantea TaxID=171969 RepID=A0A9Q1GYK9_9CARY|nr:LOW QUALITY PROTEIN: hypothetical protein Cgig2_021068 [Carnegiea gigantea]